MWVTRLQVWCDIYSTQAVKKVAKSVEKAVKKGAVDISRPFKKCRKVSSESVGRSFFPIVAIVFFTEYYIYLKVSNNQGNIGSTKETLATETSVIDINPSDDEGNGSEDDKSPKEELSKFDLYYVIFSLTDATVLQNILRKHGALQLTVFSKAMLKT